MKKKTIIAVILFLSLTTIVFPKKILFTSFDLKEINIENNLLLEDKEIKKLLGQIYGKNLIFIKNKEIEKALIQNSFIEGFNVKKKYPNKLQIKIYEKKPIAILINEKNKFYLSEKIDLIEYRNLKNFQNLPNVFGNEREFKIFYNELKKMNFPFDIIKKFTYFNSNRWDLETSNEIVIRLPPKNYLVSLQNYLDLKAKSDFKKYKVFDYRVNNQLILK